MFEVPVSLAEKCRGLVSPLLGQLSFSLEGRSGVGGRMIGDGDGGGGGGGR